MATAMQTIKRADGSEVKIVAEEFFGAGLTRSIGVYVLKRPNPQSQWHLCNDRPHPNWRNMSVDEYVKHGRSEMLQTVSHGEILKLTQSLGA